MVRFPTTVMGDGVRTTLVRADRVSHVDRLVEIKETPFLAWQK